MEFAELASVFEKLESTSKRLALAEDLGLLFGSSRPDEARILAYLCQGVLVPEFQGIQLGIGDKLAEQAIALVSGGSVKSVESSYRKTGDLGTTAQELLANKRQHFLSSSKLSVRKVYDNFFKLATTGGTGSQELKIKLLAELLSNAEPTEAKIIVRFVIGNLRLGIGEPTILDGLARLHVQRLLLTADSISFNEKEFALSQVESAAKGEAESLGASHEKIASLQWLRIHEKQPALAEALGKKGGEAVFLSKGRRVLEATLAIRINHSEGTACLLGMDTLEARRNAREDLDRAYNLTSDLGLVAETYLKEGMRKIESFSPKVFSPIRPALAERLENAQAIIDKIGPCIVEGKFDGLRLQAHKKGEEVRLFSRRQEPVTHMFPDIVRGVREQVRAREAIVEGEAIAVDEATGEFAPFQATIQRKRKHGVEEKAGELPLKLFAFELLFADGVDFTREPYSIRRKKLEGLIKKGEVIELPVSIEASTGAVIEKFFDESVTAGLEGVIAKDLNAPYTAGARKFAWIKLKRSYQGSLADTVDAVVIGYYRGKGKRTQFGFGGFLTAVYSQEDNSFKSVAKVGTGFSEKEMGEFHKQMQAISLKSKPENVESVLIPDVWVKPQVVITLNADEITRSPTHVCGAGKLTEADEHSSVKKHEGLALRFPRIIGVRPDKSAKEATSEQEILELYELQRRSHATGESIPKE